MSKAALQLMSPFILVCALSSCAPHYDAMTDALLVNTQQKLDAGLLRLETDRKLLDEAGSGGSANADVSSVQKDSSFASNIGFYSDVGASLITAEERMGPRTHNPPQIIDSLEKLRTGFQSLEDLHRKDGLPGAESLSINQQTMDQQFRTLMTYEAQLQSGTTTK